MKKPAMYLDLSKLSEDDRIKAMGNLVMQERVATRCLTDDEPGKIERYKQKMHDWFPLITLGEIKRGFPTPGCGWVHDGSPKHS